MEFRQIELFLAAAQHETLHAAADHAGISQPALTKSIHRLEATLGVRLFDRHARGIRLTVFGEALLSHAQSMWAELQHATDAMRVLRSTASGLVRLGAGPSMCVTLLPEVTSRLMQQGHAIRLIVRSGLNDSILAALHAGEIDFAITTMAATTPGGIINRRLFTDNVVVAARHDHPLRTKDARFEDLAAARWVMPNPNVLTRMKLTELFHARGLDAPGIQIVSDSIPYITEMVSRTDLLSYMPMDLVRAGNLGAVAVPGSVWKRSVAVSYWRRHTVTSAGRMFISLLETVARDMHAS